MAENFSYNTSRILQKIWHKKSISRVAIAKELHLSKSTITKNIAPLIEDGIVIFKEKQESTTKGGRKAEGLTIDKKFGYILGIEIQTEISIFCITDLSGEIIFSDRIVNENTTENFLALLENIIQQSLVICKLRKFNILGVSVGLAGIINPLSGIIIQSNPFKINSPTNIYSKLDNYAFPILIENDANCCCYKEIAFHKRNRSKNFMCILGEFRKPKIKSRYNSGVSVGLGLGINGKILHGRDFSAGEFQSINKEISNPSQFNLTLEELDNIEKDENVQKKFLRELARNISLLVNTMNFSSIYFEGNIVKTENILRPILRDEIQRNWPFESQVDCQIDFSNNSSTAVAQGAACFFLDKLFSPQRFWEDLQDFYPSGIDLFNRIKTLK